jgi:cytochrome c oxidase subunit 3
MAQDHEHYYVPSHSYWPIVGAVGLGFFATGVVNTIQSKPMGGWLFLIGAFIIVGMLFGWFRDVITESRGGLYGAQMDRSFRMGMMWFIFSEVMFFVAFFGALFYARTLIVPWLGGEGQRGMMTNAVLWPGFEAAWPLLSNPDPETFKGPTDTIGPWGLPAINTAILLLSGVTITWSHWALKKSARFQLSFSLFLTAALGMFFLYLQVQEYIHAYHELGLTLNSGIYGSTFFMLTGFHGAHVTLGTIMILIILGRCLAGHFSPKHHFAFEAVAWYWHFVDVVWLFLFIFVYWL